MSNANLDQDNELGLIGIKKYWKRSYQVETELDWQHDWISTLAIFVRYSRKEYNNEKMTKNIKVRQDIRPE